MIYAYGCSYEALCTGSGGTAPAYFFAPDGGYDIYDYRDPGELRIDAVAEAIIAGHIDTGAITQDVAVGGELFLRSVQQPGAPPADAPSTVQDGAVYAYVGSENIYQPIAPVPIETPLETAGPRTLWEDNHQSAGIVQDSDSSSRSHSVARRGTIRFSARQQLLAQPQPAPEPLPSLPTSYVWLPQYAITINPANSLTLYGNYGVMLSLGPQGPWWVDNASQFLTPYMTRQAEVGAKYEPGSRILLTGDLFHMRAPFFYPKVIEAPDSFCTCEANSTARRSVLRVGWA